ncbi:MAG: hypothetical protein DHS80DRAFT_25063 [Piptocephalis tieghemiana]|nr:MAG: hypothetical protein DHS80DRAFT_25063 [Piptocephalis tieghemiana]
MGNVLTKKPFHLSGHPSERHPTFSPSPTERLDQGFFVPQTTLYPPASRDYHTAKVHHLQLARRLAPFYPGKDEADSLPIPPSSSSQVPNLSSSSPSPPPLIKDDVEADLKDDSKSSPSLSPPLTTTLHRSASMDHLILPSSDASSSSSLPFRSPSDSVSIRAPSNSGPSLTVCSANVSPSSTSKPPLIPYLAFTVECPICFLFYPTNINLTSCCRTPICTECFLQIRPPIPSDPSSSPSPSPSCPYCVSSPFTIVYTPPSSFSGNKPEESVPVSSKDVRLPRPSPPSSSSSSSSSSSNRLFQASRTRQDRSNTGAGGVTDLFRSDRRLAQHHERARRAMSILLDPAPSHPMNRQITPRQMNRYLSSAQALGVDIEEMMMAEAIRRSLITSEAEPSSSSSLPPSSPDSPAARPVSDTPIFSSPPSTSHSIPPSPSLPSSSSPPPSSSSSSPPPSSSSPPSPSSSSSSSPSNSADPAPTLPVPTIPSTSS